LGARRGIAPSAIRSKAAMAVRLLKVHACPPQRPHHQPSHLLRDRVRVRVRV